MQFSSTRSGCRDVDETHTCEAELQARLVLWIMKSGTGGEEFCDKVLYEKCLGDWCVPHTQIRVPYDP